jgi:hypothetical protein
VLANDILPSCYAQAVAAVEVSRWPAYRKFSGRYRDALSSKDFIEGMHVQGDILEHDDGQESPRRVARRLPLARAVHYLNTCIEPEEGLVYRNYCPGGGADRRYFTDENGRRLDGILGFLAAQGRQGSCNDESQSVQYTRADLRDELSTSFASMRVACWTRPPGWPDDPHGTLIPLCLIRDGMMWYVLLDSDTGGLASCGSTMRR